MISATANTACPLVHACVQGPDADLLADDASEELLELELQATPQTANAKPGDSRVVQAYEGRILELDAQVQALRDQLHEQGKQTQQLKVRYYATK
jgi:hypothetical protein